MLTQRRIVDRHMIAGVTVVDPAATVIDVDVKIGEDTVIAPFTSLHGATENRWRLDDRSAFDLIDALRRSRVPACCTPTSRDAAVGDRGSARTVRLPSPGDDALRAGSKVGTFVEVKNSDVGAGTKIPHLSYIGDADIGERTNLGASYDHRQLRRRSTSTARRSALGVKTSVHTTLVAPVEGWRRRLYRRPAR